MISTPLFVIALMIAVVASWSICSLLWNVRLKDEINQTWRDARDHFQHVLRDRLRDETPTEPMHKQLLDDCNR